MSDKKFKKIERVIEDARKMKYGEHYKAIGRLMFHHDVTVKEFLEYINYLEEKMPVVESYFKTDSNGYILQF
jgi:hypothetical protein